MDPSILRWTYHLPKLSPEQFAAIGRAIQNWAFLEEQVNTALSLSLRLDTQQGLALTIPMRNFRLRVEALLGIWKCTDREATEKELKPLMVEILRLYSFRNSLAHRPWWASHDDEIHSFNLHPDNLPFHPAELRTNDEIEQAATAMIGAIERLQDFVELHLPLMAASQDRFSAPSPASKNDPHSSP